MKHTSVGQLLLVGVQGLELGVDEAKLLRQVQPGGFILFGRNIKTPNNCEKLVDDLRKLSLVEPIITIDQEGGRVSRLRLIGNEPPSAQQLRDKGDIELIRQHGDITGDLLRLFGFNLDLCPVLDISFDDDADNSLRGRCYGKTVEQVIRNAAAFNNELRAPLAVASCGNISPATPLRWSMPIIVCRKSIGPANSWIAKNSQSSALLRATNREQQRTTLSIA